MKIFNKYLLPLLAISLLGGNVDAQKNKKLENSLLWEISGNGLTKPSYLYGTIHMICKEDAMIGDSLVSAIQKSDRVYFEVDMDNLMEMLTAFKDFKMRNDTTLADLLSKEDYRRVKE